MFSGFRNRVKLRKFKHYIAMCICMFKPLFCLLLIPAILASTYAHAQLPETVQSNTRMSDSLVALYRNSIAQGNRFYNGTEYMGYVMRPKGHPFFQSERMQLAEISHEGVVYTDSILYDLVDDAIIVRSFDGAYNFRMVDEKVRSFKVLGLMFVRLGAFTDSTSQITPGFYEQVYNGKSAVFVRHRKQVNSTTIQGEIFSEYVQYDSYFVRRGNQYYSVYSIKTLLGAFDEKRGEVRRFLRDQNLDFRKDPLNTTRRAAEFFDQLNK